VFFVAVVFWVEVDGGGARVEAGEVAASHGAVVVASCVFFEDVGVGAGVDVGED
jgi:hypothetical protein